MYDDAREVFGRQLDEIRAAGTFKEERIERHPKVLLRF